MGYLISFAICHGRYRSVHCHKVDRQARTMTKQKGRCTAIQRPFLYARLDSNLRPFGSENCDIR